MIDVLSAIGIRSRVAMVGCTKKQIKNYVTLKYLYKPPNGIWIKFVRPLGD